MAILKQTNTRLFDELFNSFPSGFANPVNNGYPVAAVNIH